jgi:hypothetical protein
VRLRPKHNARLAGLFEIGSGKPAGWADDELSDIFSHQLRAPLLTDLKPPAAQLESLGLANLSPDGPPLTTFGDLLAHPSPTLPLLQLAKDFAKTADNRLEGPLPSPVAVALYYAIIAAALVTHGVKITEIDNAALQNGLEWLQKQHWITSGTRQLAGRALIAARSN